MPHRLRPFVFRLKPSFFMLCCWFALPAWAEEPPLGAALAPLIAHAHEHHPALAASRFAVQGAYERVTQATALPDPRLEMEWMDVGNAQTPGRSASLVPGEVSTAVRVSQMWPFAGKRALRGEVAMANAHALDAQATQVRVAVARSVGLAYVAYYRATEEERLLAQSHALTAVIESIAMKRYGLGLAAQAEVLAAQAQTTALQVALTERRQSRLAAQARLNAVLTRPPQAPLAAPVALPVIPLPQTLEALIAQALPESPTLMEAQFGRQAAEHERALTYRDRYPDWGLSVTNTRPLNGPERWDLMLEVTLPFQQGARRAREREAEYALEAARAREESLRAQLWGELGRWHAEYHARQDQARLIHTTLIPQTQAGLASARAAYESGAGEFAAVLNAQERLLRARLSGLEADSTAATSAIELQALLGARP